MHTRHQFRRGSPLKQAARQQGGWRLGRMVASWAFSRLSGNSAEYCVPPGSEVRVEFGDIDDERPMYVATTRNNDGYELWIAYNEGGGWLGHFRVNEARQLARIILWDWWIVSTWCGLKRKIWYWALRNH